MNYVYILECADGTLYTGWTNDLTARLAAHNSGHGAKYTRGRGPVRLAFSEVFADRGEALSYEAAIKKLTREEKLRLIAGRRTPGAEYLTVLDAHGRRAATSRVRRCIGRACAMRSCTYGRLRRRQACRRMAAAPRHGPAAQPGRV